jgi:hypothetical protein
LGGALASVLAYGILSLKLAPSSPNILAGGFVGVLITGGKVGLQRMIEWDCCGQLLPRQVSLASYRIGGLGYRSVGVLAMYLSVIIQLVITSLARCIESFISQYRNRIPTSIHQLLQPRISWGPLLIGPHVAANFIDQRLAVPPRQAGVSTSPSVPVGISR